MVSHGVKGIISGVAEREVDRIFHLYRDAAAERGQELELGENLCLGLRFFLDDSPRRARRTVTPYVEEHWKFFLPLGLKRESGDPQTAAPGGSQGPTPDRRPALDEDLRNRIWLCGPAEDAVASLKELEQRSPGLEHLMITRPVGMPRAIILEQLGRFVAEVIPACRSPQGPSPDNGERYA